MLAEQARSWDQVPQGSIFRTFSPCWVLSYSPECLSGIVGRAATVSVFEQMVFGREWFARMVRQAAELSFLHKSHSQLVSLQYSKTWYFSVFENKVIIGFYFSCKFGGNVGVYLEHIGLSMAFVLPDLVRALPDLGLIDP